MTNAGEFKRALCLDCLRLHDVAALKCDVGDPPGRCPVCGGQACDCNTCLFLVAELEASNLRPTGIVGELVAWSPAAGGTFRDREGIA